MNKTVLFYSFLKLVYFVVVGVACLTCVFSIVILRFHAWERVTLGVPDGLLIGLFEVALFSVCGVYSILYGARGFFNAVLAHS